MRIFYVDEAGTPEPHSEPLVDGQTPLFVLAALSFDADAWRPLDRAYLDLKKRFFRKEIGGRRPELYEVKGHDLTRPGNKRSRRNHTFVLASLGLCRVHGAVGFGVIFKKNPANPTSKTSMYTMGLQYLAERFNPHLEERDEAERGIIIADSRMRNLDLNVAVSHLSYIFGHARGRQLLRLVEAPTFTHSELSVGIQLADIFASCLYTTHYQRICTAVPGAVDYSHMAHVRPHLDSMQYRSTRAYEGYFVSGYRFIDHSVGP